MMMTATTPTSLDAHAHEFKYLPSTTAVDDGDGYGSEEEPFDCVTVDDSEEAILKKLSEVVQASDRVLEEGKVVGKTKPDHVEAMTPVRSHTQSTQIVVQQQQQKEKGATQSAPVKRFKVSLRGKQRKPNQEPIKLFVNQRKPEFEPPESVTKSTNEEDLPFDETAGHRMKVALQACLTPFAEAFKGIATTPDTSLEVEEEEEDEWSLDTDYYTQGTGGTGFDTATHGDETYEEEEDDEPDDEAQMRVKERSEAVAAAAAAKEAPAPTPTPVKETAAPTAAKETAAPTSVPTKGKRTSSPRRRSRRHREAEEERALPKEVEPGLDEWCLDMLFAPDVTETALEVADFIQKGAEITSNKAKDVLSQGIDQLEEEEKQLEGGGEVNSSVGKKGSEEDAARVPHQRQDAGKDEDSTEADAAAGKFPEDTADRGLDDSENKKDFPSDDARGLQAESDSSTPDAIGAESKPKGPKLADLLAKGLPLGYRKVQRIVKQATEQVVAAGSTKSERLTAVEETKEGLDQAATQDVTASGEDTGEAGTAAASVVLDAKAQDDESDQESPTEKEGPFLEIENDSAEEVSSQVEEKANMEENDEEPFLEIDKDALDSSEEPSEEIQQDLGDTVVVEQEEKPPQEDKEDPSVESETQLWQDYGVEEIGNADDLESAVSAIEEEEDLSYLEMRPEKDTYAPITVVDDEDAVKDPSQA
eukprot:scaffold22649_cov99-Cylindrotheca_fusiformis.AAC.3